MTLRSAKEVRGYKIQATDGELGAVDQFLFDDQHWTIRYLVADTGGWLLGRLVLISPISLKGVDQQARVLEVDLTRQQVENSPDIFKDQPVSRQREEEYFRYYNYPIYWGGPALWGATMYPASTALPLAGAPPAAVEGQPNQPSSERGDPHLRSTSEVTGYSIQARDGEIGHVDDFLVNDTSWVIEHMVVDTVNWWPGKKVLVSPQRIGTIHWAEKTVTVELMRDSIKQRPEYDPGHVLEVPPV